MIVIIQIAGYIAQNRKDYNQWFLYDTIEFVEGLQT